MNQLKLVVCSVLLVSNSLAFAQEKPLESIEEVQWMVGKWIADEEPLDMNIAGFGKKGEKVRMHFEVKPSLGGKILIGNGVLHKGEDTHAMMHHVWAVNGSDHKVNHWFFDFMGVTISGPMIHTGDEYIVKYSGKSKPKDGPIKALADRLGIEEVSFTAEAAYKLVDEDTFELIIRDVTMAGKPFPWPGANKVHVHRRVK